jgi:ankyrin repeat protein
MSKGVKGATVLAVALALWTSASLAAKSVDEPRKPDGSTPLQWAVFEANIPEAERLVKAGADVSATNNYGISPMLLAADIANTDLIRLLLKAGASAKSVNPDGETALHLVARAGNLEAAKMLLKAGAVVDAREKLGQQTPLMWAVARRHPEMVELLINSGADMNARSAIRDYQRVATAESRAKSLDRGGFTPLLYAARENCRECAEILIKHGADVGKPDPSGVPPLVIAMMNSNWDIAKRLVEAGADVNQWDMYGLSPLAVAIGGMGTANGRNPLDDDRPNTATGPELVQMLIERGANPNQQTYFRPGTGRGGGRGTTPFMAAISSGNVDLVKQLLAKGADARLATSEGQGPIILAVQVRGGGGGGGGGGFGGGGRGGGGCPWWRGSR